MLKHLPIVVSILMLYGNTFGQKVIFGKVSDGLTQEALPYVNVFINNTTLGTVTDENGEYTLTIPTGEVEVVFSFVGYQSHKVTSSSEVRDAFAINIELFPIKQELQTVTVRDKVDKVWQKRIKQFQKVFLGDTYAARYSTIRNAWCIDLKREKISGKQVLVARASQPLEIENLALGYKLYYDLQNFSASRERDTFYGYVYFIELEPKDSVQAEIWARNRRDAYLGSSLHLFRSILSGRISEEGYNLFTHSDPIDKTKLIPYTPSDVQFNSLKKKYRIPAEQKIEIRFKKEPAPKALLAGSMNFTGGHADVDHQGAVLNPLEIITTGYISNLRVANLLPNNYELPPSEFAMNGSSAEEVSDLGTVVKSNQPRVQNFPMLDDLTKKALYYSENHPNEKVYLHFDRQFYIIGEDSWYKAYVVRESDLSPTDISSVLYVDWIDPSGNIVSHERLRIENGGSAGELAIDTTLADGTYTVRAYTNWMRNEDPEWFYSRKIRIIDPRLPQATADGGNDRGSIDLQFFPEGGTLIAGVQTQIAFKAIDSNGKGTDVIGKIVDDQGRFVTTFRSSHGGMGSFPLITDGDNSFQAVLPDGTVYPLPQPRASGYSLAASNMSSEKIIVRIQCTGFNDSLLYLTGHSRGSIQYAESIKMDKTFKDISISKQELSEGILQLTLFNDKGIPQCERMLFIKKFNETKVSIQSDKEVYSPRDSITLNLIVGDAESNPLETSLSVSVTDAEFNGVDNYSETIYTRLLFQSDLKGNVENPGWYFESQTSEKMYALDLVMLTHGWSRFNWNKILSPTDSIRFMAQTGINIKGHILVNNKAVQNAPFTVRFAQPEGEFINIYETDSVGNFIVPDLDFSDSTMISWRVMGGRKGRVQNAEILLDTARDLLPFNGAQVERASHAVEHEMWTKLIARFIKTGIWSVENSILLDEVVVKAERLKIKTVGLNTIAVKPGPEDLEGLASTFVNRYLPGLSGARLITRSDGAYIWTTQQGAPIMITINGMMQDTTGLGANPFVVINKIPIEQIETVIISGSMVAIITKSESVEEAVGTISNIVNGYHKAREFYHPKYGPSHTTPPGPDNRITLYWNPNLQTGKDGKATVKFYNTDSTQKLLITVEGIADGQPISTMQVIGEDD